MKRIALLGFAPLLAVATLHAAAADKPADKPSSDKGAATDSAAAAQPAPVAQPLAVAGDLSVTQADVEAAVRGQLLELHAKEYELMADAARKMMSDRLLAREAELRKLSVEELLKAEVDAKAAPVADQDADTLYQQNKARLAGKSEEEGKQMARDYLASQAREKRKSEFLAELRQKAGFRILLEPPRVAVDEGDNPARGGSKDAPVTMVEFSDFQCPYCGRVTPTLKTLEERYGDKLRVVFRDFPLPIHPLAPKAAEAGACAREQGKFWEMHDALFANQQSLQVADLKKRAADLGLDSAAFDACLDSGKSASAWQVNRDAGQRLGVSGTPAFFINGRPLVGARPLQDFVEVIDDELARAAATKTAAAR